MALLRSCVMASAGTSAKAHSERRVSSAHLVRVRASGQAQWSQYGHRVRVRVVKPEAIR